MFNPSTVQINRIPQVKYNCVNLREGETGIFRKSNKHCVVSFSQRRECTTSLNVQEYVAEKNIDVEENVQPKHGPN